MKENIIINEVGLRECFQNINKIYNLENKLQLLDGLICKPKSSPADGRC